MSWTEGRKRAFITAVLRGGMRRFPPKYETLNKAYVGTKVNEKTKRLAKHYECNMCKQHFTAKDVEVDHVNPVVDPDVGFVSWDLFIERLYCKMENLQLLCRECHKEKTKSERKIRSLHKMQVSENTVGNVEGQPKKSGDKQLVQNVSEREVENLEKPKHRKTKAKKTTYVRKAARLHVKT